MVCGQPYFNEVFKQLGEVRLHWLVAEGEQVKANTRLGGITRPGPPTAQRRALCTQFSSQTLSGTATTTAEYVALVGQAAFKLLDTRKTIPGLRLAQK